MRHMTRAMALLTLVGLALTACSSPTTPTSSTAALDRFVQALREQGLTVDLAGQLAPSANGFFSVPAEQIRVNDSQLSAFVYRNSDAAVAEASQISRDGQPSPTSRVLWVSTPWFYQKDTMIVLYVGCAANILHALQETIGAPIVVGPNQC